MDRALDSRIQAAIQSWRLEHSSAEERILQKLEHERTVRTDVVTGLRSDMEKLVHDLQTSCKQNAWAIHDTKASVDAVRQQQEVQSAGLSRLAKNMDQISTWATTEMEGSRAPSRARQTSTAVDPISKEDRNKLHLQLAALTTQIDNISQSGSQVSAEQIMRTCDEYMSSRAQDIMNEIAEVRKSWIHEAAALRAHIDGGLKQAQVPADSLGKLRALLDASRADMRSITEEIAHERVERYNAIQELRQRKDPCSTPRPRSSVPSSHENDAEERCNKAADAVEAQIRQLEGLKVELQQMRTKLATSIGTDALSNSAALDFEPTIRMLKEGVTQVQKELPILAKAVVDTRNEVRCYVSEEQSKRLASESRLGNRVCKLEELISTVRSNISSTKSMQSKEPKRISESIPSCGASTAGSTISGEDNINSTTQSQASLKASGDLKGNLDTLIAAVQMTLRDESGTGQESRPPQPSESKDAQNSARGPFPAGNSGVRTSSVAIAQDRQQTNAVINRFTTPAAKMGVTSPQVQSRAVSQGPAARGSLIMTMPTTQINVKPASYQVPVQKIGFS